MPQLTHLFVLSAVPLLSGPLPAQSMVGSGCPGASGTVPSFAPRSLVREGLVSIADVTGQPGTTCLVLGGLNTSSWLGADLPLDLSAFGTEFAGCTLYQAPGVQLPVALDAAGEAALPLSGWPAGLTASIQVWNLDLGPTSFGGFSPATLLTSGAFEGPLYPSGLTLAGPGFEGDLQFVDVDSDGILDSAFARLAELTVHLSDGAGAFGAPLTTSVGGNQNALAWGDFNGDGRLDAVSPLRDLDLVRPLLGNGDGTFQLLFSTPSGGDQPEAAFAADLDLDGDLDLIVSHRVSADVAVHDGLGNGSFAAPQVVPLGFEAGDVRAAELNGDGRLDLLVRGRLEQDLRAVLSQPNGTLAAGPALDGSGSDLTFDLADLDLDGDVDLVVAERFPATFRSLLNAGDGGFAETLLPSGPQLSGPILLGDLNNDGPADLVFASNQAVGVRYGLGDGSFTTALATPSIGGTEVSSLADLDGDGHLDVLARQNTLFGGQMTSWIGIFPGSETVGLDAPTELLANRPAEFLQAADLDGDARLDLMVGQRDGTVTHFVKRVDGRFVGPTPLEGFFRADEFDFGDLNGDGWLDLAVCNSTSNPRISVQLGLGDGSFGEALDESGGFDVERIRAHDMNGDGLDDVVALAPFGGVVEVRLASPSGDGSLLPPVTTPTAPVFVPRLLTLDDFDGDGRADLVVAAQFPDSGQALLLGDGSGGFSSPQNLPFTEPCNELLSVDVDSDGGPDLVQVSLFPTRIHVALNLGAGQFAAPTVIDPGLLASALTAGDLNGDGAPDLAYRGILSSSVQTLIGDGLGGFTPGPASSSLPLFVETLGLADLNQDGRLDLFGTTSETQLEAFTALGSGDATFGTAEVYPLVQQSTASSERVRAGAWDLDRDNALDLVWGAKLSSPGRLVVLPSLLLQ